MDEESEVGQGIQSREELEAPKQSFTPLAASYFDARCVSHFVPRWGANCFLEQLPGSHESACIVALKSGESIVFQGCILVKVLAGALHVHGYQISALEEHWLPMYSSATHSLLSMDAAADAGIKDMHASHCRSAADPHLDLHPMDARLIAAHARITSRGDFRCVFAIISLTEERRAQMAFAGDHAWHSEWQTVEGNGASSNHYHPHMNQSSMASPHDHHHLSKAIAFTKMGLLFPSLFRHMFRPTNTRGLYNHDGLRPPVTSHGGARGSKEHDRSGVDGFGVSGFFPIFNLPRSGLTVTHISDVWSDASNRLDLEIEQILNVRRASQVITEPLPIIIICGNKNVGKSTFGRYLLNSLLNRLSCVAFLEADVGQTEFTPPGMLSLSFLTRPALGPPFSHLQHAERAYFFGDTSPENDPEYYLDCIRSLMASYQSLPTAQRPPLIVNTHGWIKGLGRDLLEQLLLEIKPTKVYQFTNNTNSSSACTSGSGNRNGSDNSNSSSSIASSEDLANPRPSIFSKRPGTETSDITTAAAPGDNEPFSATNAFKADIVQMSPAVTADAGVMRFKLSSSEHRRLSLLTYLCGMALDRPHGLWASQQHPQQHQHQHEREHSLLPIQTVGREKLPIHPCERRSYRVRWREIGLHVIHSEVPNSQLLAAINGELVALISHPSPLLQNNQKNASATTDTADLPYFVRKTPLTPCLGLGVVRAVDTTSKEILLITPEEKEMLSGVNMLLKGAVSIPSELILSQAPMQSHSAEKPFVPYINELDDSLGALPRKARHNLLRRRMGGR